MFRKSVAVAATAALLCGSAIALGAAEHAPGDRVPAAQSRLSLQLIQQLAYARGAGNNLVVSPASLEPVEMKVDKPFVFALRDSETGLILMSGYVGRPAPVKTAAQ